MRNHVLFYLFVFPGYIFMFFLFVCFFFMAKGVHSRGYGKHIVLYSTQTNAVVSWDCGILIWHLLTGLKSPKCCGGSASNPRKTPIDPVGQLQSTSTSNRTECIDGHPG